MGVNPRKRRKKNVFPKPEKWSVYLYYSVTPYITTNMSAVQWMRMNTNFKIEKLSAAEKKTEAQTRRDRSDSMVKYGASSLWRHSSKFQIACMSTKRSKIKLKYICSASVCVWVSVRVCISASKSFWIDASRFLLFALAHSLTWTLNTHHSLFVQFIHLLAHSSIQSVSQPGLAPHFNIL